VVQPIKRRHPRRAIGVDTPIWLFDLDNTLHDASDKILPQINRDMTDYVSRALGLDTEKASLVRRQLWQRYGATLTGMVRLHGVDPVDFLRQTHQFDDLTDWVAPQFQLARWLDRLPGKKILLTNAPSFYANLVLQAAALHRGFDAVVSIETMQFAGGWTPKPSPAMYRRLKARLRFGSRRVLLIEDTPENLHGAHRLGIRGVWVRHMAQSRQRNPHRAGRGRKVSVQVQSVKHISRIAFK
jgi:putative hydrolase of the HAD superfamily